MKNKVSEENIDDILKYYKSNNEEHRILKQQLEYQVTWSLLQKYLKPKSKILELGAGSGHYTLHLARAGHTIVSIDLVPELVELSRQKLKNENLEKNVTLHVGDARNIPQTSEKFDAILVMGPLYHLTSKIERMNLMKNLNPLIHQKGLIISSHLTRIGVMSYMLARFPAWGLEFPDQAEHIMSVGHLPNHPKNGEFRGYFTTVEEIEDLHVNANFSVPKIHSQDPCIAAADELFNHLPEDIKESWVHILTEISDEPLALGSGRSLLSIAHKE